MKGIWHERTVSKIFSSPCQISEIVAGSLSCSGLTAYICCWNTLSFLLMELWLNDFTKGWLWSLECETPYHLSYCRSPTRLQFPSCTLYYLLLWFDGSGMWDSLSPPILKKPHQNTISFFYFRFLGITKQMACVCKILLSSPRSFLWTCFSRNRYGKFSSIEYSKIT